MSQNDSPATSAVLQNSAIGMVQTYLKEISAEINKDLRLNHYGICIFNYGDRDYTITANDQKETVCLSSVVYTLPTQSVYERQRGAVVYRALELSYLSIHTHGAIMTLQGDNIMLQYEDDPIRELTRSLFRQTIENFISTAEYVVKELDEAAQKVSAEDYKF